jgi:hypothetical protein
MEQKHTPGPWAVSKQKRRRVTASGKVICNAVLRNRGGPKHKTELKDEHEAEANAALIAAAPDLLAALEKIERALGGASNGTMEAEAAACARAAIAKACDA